MGDKLARPGGESLRKAMVAGIWGSWSHCVHSQEAEIDECLCSLVFLSLFVWAEIPA